VEIYTILLFIYVRGNLHIHVIAPCLEWSISFYHQDMATLFQLICCSVLTLVTGTWTPESYPSKHDSLCDPDGILPVQAAKNIVDRIKNIEGNSTTSCGGYQIAVALARSIETNFLQSKIAAARDFAMHLHDKWGVGHHLCQDGILLFFAMDTRVVFISTGAGSNIPLPDELGIFIIRRMKHLLRQHKYEAAIKQALDDISKAIDGILIEDMKHQYYWDVCFLKGMWMCIILFIGYKYWNKFHYKKAMVILQRIEEEQSRRKKCPSFGVTSCPICLEDFSSESKLLDCGHTFCHDCITQWTSKHSTCPICRQVICDDTEQHYEPYDTAEVSFRLRQVHKRYPRYVTKSMITRWSRSDYHGSFMKDMSFVRASPTYSSSKTSNKRFGGGSSRGGSGGSW
jgi:uncharacterized membrane protein YgcG